MDKKNAQAAINNQIERDLYDDKALSGVYLLQFSNQSRHF
jgi:hypothetical protein